jgi:hypothetical protein
MFKGSVAASEGRREERQLPARTFAVEPFDLLLYLTPDGVLSLQSRIMAWLRGLSGPARFLSYQFPATLDDKIGQVTAAMQAQYEARSPRADLLMEYRRFYEGLNQHARYQRSQCALVVWSADDPRAIAGGISASFDTPAYPAPLPPLFEGRYMAQSHPYWHLAPVERPGGRPFWAILTSYEFLPSRWDFVRPLEALLHLDFPLALSLDIARTYRVADHGVSGASVRHDHRRQPRGAAYPGLPEGIGGDQPGRFAPHGAVAHRYRRDGFENATPSRADRHPRDKGVVSAACGNGTVAEQGLTVLHRDAHPTHRPARYHLACHLARTRADVRSCRLSQAVRHTGHPARRGDQRRIPLFP